MTPPPPPILASPLPGINNEWSLSQVFAYVSDNSFIHVHKRIGNRPMRNFSVSNLNNFKTRLSQVNWTGLLNDKDPNDSYKKFLSEYSRLYNFCFPLKPLKVKNCKRLSSPWITKSLLVSVRKKNKLYRQLLRSMGIHPFFSNLNSR